MDNRKFMKRAASTSLLASPTHELTLGSSFSSGHVERALSPFKRKSAHQPPLSVSQFYQTPFETAYNDLAKQRNLHKLAGLFVEADTDGSGEMSLNEFHEALRKPRFQRTFSALGVQPHQSELVFMSMLHNNNGYDIKKVGTEELSIHHFMEGLTQLVGASPDGTGKELDIDMLKPTREAKLRREGFTAPGLDSKSPSACGDDTLSPTSNGKKKGINIGGLGPVHLLPDVTIHRAFVHSATAKALQPPNAAKRPVRCHSAG